MSLAVILLNWRDQRRTLRCAQAVAAWRALEPQIIIIDNESTQATGNDLTATTSADNLIRSAENLGFAGGNNLGIRHALAAKREYVLLLNTDAEISAANVARLLGRLKTNPQISILGPVIRVGDDVQTRLVGGRDIARYSSTQSVVAAADVKKFSDYPIHEVDYVSGTVLLARSEIFSEIGLLDEEYFFSGEIADFCERAKNRGRKVCVDLEVEALHDIHQTPTHLRETLYLYYGLRNRFLYVRKHRAKERIAYFFFWTFLGATGFGRALLRGNLARARAIMLALMDGYRGRYGNQNARFL